MRAQLMLVALLVGCAHAHVDVKLPDVTPLTYRPRSGTTLERGAGRLRRLALVVTPFEASPRDPRWCLDPCDAAAYQRDAAARALVMLRDWRGYEVVGADAPSVPDAAHLAALGAALGVDGVLVVRARLVWLTWLDAASWFATLSFSIPLSLARAGPRGEVAIYETASARLVWRSRVRGSGDTRADELADALLAPLELAWPRALAQPPRAQ